MSDDTWKLSDADFGDDAMWAELIATHNEQKFMSPRGFRRVCAKLRSLEAAESALATARAEAAEARAELAGLRETVRVWAETKRGGLHTDTYRSLRALLASPEARDAGEGGGCDGNG
jgi:hypothetical protein